MPFEVCNGPWPTQPTAPVSLGISDDPLQVEKSEGVLVARTCRMRLAQGLAEPGAIEIGKECVAFGCGIDLGQMDAVGMG